MAKKQLKRSIFQVNFGYRALLDWTNSSNWSRGEHSQISTTGRGLNMAFNMGTGSYSKLSGPHSFGIGAGSSGVRQRENFWGQDETSAKIPGSAGAFFDVHNNTPSGPAPSGAWIDTESDKEDVQGTISAIMSDLGSHAQQWLYLAAENMAAKGTKLLETGKISQDELKRLGILLDIEEDELGVTTTEATRESMTQGTGLGESHMAEMVDPMVLAGVKYDKKGNVIRIGSRVQTEGGDSAGSRMMAQSMSRGADVFPTGSGMHVAKGLKGQRFGGGKFKGKQGWLETAASLEQTKGEEQFRNMLVGVRGQWINLFAHSLINRLNAEDGVGRLAAMVEKAMEKHAIQFSGDKAATFRPSKERTFTIDPETGKSSTTITQMDFHGAGGGGQSPQELATIRAFADKRGGGIFATGKYGQRGIGHGIDIRFKKNVIIPIKRAGKTILKGRKTFNKVDLTTSFFRKGSHHGIGTPLNEDGEKLKAGTSIPESEKFVREHYRKRIKQFNYMINYIREATGVKSTRRGAKETDLGYAKRSRGRVWRARQIWNKLPKKAQAAHAKTMASSAIFDEGKSYVSNDLVWILHHMANMLPGGVVDPDPYAMTAPFLISRNPRDVGLLFVVFDINLDGTYKQMDMREDPSSKVDGSYVYIDSDAPMDWLHGKAVEEGYRGTLEEFGDMGSIAVAAETLNAEQQSGVAFLNLSKTGSNINAQVMYSKLSAPVVADTLTMHTDEFFFALGKGLERELQEDMHNDAVKYSIHARNPGSMNEINKWVDFGVRYLMTRSAADARLNDTMDYTAVSGSHRGMQRGLAGAEVKKVWEMFGKGKVAGLDKTAGDPYWYLWAAPYVSRERIGIGGAQTGYLSD